MEPDVAKIVRNAANGESSQWQMTSSKHIGGEIKKNKLAQPQWQKNFVTCSISLQ